MRIYVVTSGEYSGYGIEAIFSSEEAAKSFMGVGRCGDYGDDLDLEIWEMDDPKDTADTHIAVYSSSIFLDNGKETIWSGARLRRVKIGEKFVPPKTEIYSYAKQFGGDYIIGYSLESPEHAHKLAVEGRQQWLRERDARAAENMPVRPGSSGAQE